MPVSAATICVLANPGSGRNSRDAEAINVALAVFGPQAELRHWEPGDDLEVAVKQAVVDGFSTIVAAGGDGTVMGVAHALAGTKARLAVLPLGTFNYFARGLGIPQEPREAAEAILAGHTKRISVGAVNGQVFLNNASIGIYPKILREREDIYSRFGRRRIAAHWSVIRTVIRFQRPMTLRLTTDGTTRSVRTPLLFVARSAYQLSHFGLDAQQTISDDGFALFIAKGTTRMDLLNLALRLATKTVVIGRDVEMIPAKSISVETLHPMPDVAFDGEKARMKSPLDFRILTDALEIIVPDTAHKAAA
ncbi:NAD(+)/NADH kinase [Fertoebacter nigrum]|uniref:NAD(+)/NADH kinase n=1 Tax=Fertoeibacter niger TaxID=2656921 RepID=A0A8X8GZC6_9RHOB|nr:diacylglycerol kinase family protein [Fertoeibacter niger]NUB44638.1 NAD(+)/NADH kinase [Fertoeibacter niger]